MSDSGRYKRIKSEEKEVNPLLNLFNVFGLPLETTEKGKSKEVTREDSASTISLKKKGHSLVLKTSPALIG